MKYDRNTGTRFMNQRDWSLKSRLYRLYYVGWSMSITVPVESFTGFKNLSTVRLSFVNRWESIIIVVTDKRRSDQKSWRMVHCERCRWGLGLSGKNPKDLRMSKRTSEQIKFHVKTPIAVSISISGFNSIHSFVVSSSYFITNRHLRISV